LEFIWDWMAVACCFQFIPVERSMVGKKKTTQSFPPLETVCKNAFPFTIACPSFVYPAGYLENVRRLAPHVDEIQLLFFESRAQSLPSRELIRQLADLAETESITYNIHLPTDLYAGHPEANERQNAVDVVRQLLDLCAPLAASTCTLHLNRNPDESATLSLDRWQAYLIETVERMLLPKMDHRQVSIETLDYPFEQVAPIIATADLSVCMDMGHLMVHGVDIERFFERWQDRISIVHLHGVDGASDHLPLDRLAGNQMHAVLDILQAFSGVVSLEIYSHAGLDTSLAHLRREWRGRQAEGV
jgi:sugar phosphate isomerase/epimerase